MAVVAFNKDRIEELAKAKGLRLVLLYGSHAAGNARADSDIDVAVLGHEKIRPELLVDLNNDFARIMDAPEIDLKSLHDVDPLFRFQVMWKGIPLYGSRGDYLSFKAYAYRDYHDSRDLFRLKKALINKRLGRKGASA
jgi:predicted nucleotidyltransferase